MKEHKKLRPSFVITSVAGVVASLAGAPIAAADPAPPRPALCPATEPVRGAPCTISPTITCGYHDCGGYYTYNATCLPGHTWQVAEMSCNPPRPPPAPPPPGVNPPPIPIVHTVNPPPVHQPPPVHTHNPPPPRPTHPVTPPPRK